MQAIDVVELLNNHLFCSSGFKCSGASIAIENMIWATIKKVCQPLV